jgi:uncharacterized protein YbaP (TraB family)
MLFTFALAAVLQPASPPPTEDDAIVITARRTGIPVWKVKRGDSTVVLIGTLTEVAAETEWNARALEATVAQSRRVIFPQTQQLRLSQSELDAFNKRWEKQARLPDGQRLSSMLDPADQARLGRLAAQGFALRDWDEIHPLHLAMSLQNTLLKRTGIEDGVDTAIEKAIRTHKVYRVPIKQANVYRFDSLFSSKPKDHVACLKAMLDVAEGGPEAMRKRSAAWARRDVPAAVDSPVEAIETRCWQAVDPKTASAALIQTTLGALKRKGTTLAIVNLDTLARPGGLLDRLMADGMTIDGPAWR